MNEIVKKCEEKMRARVQSFEKELTKVRTGQASIALLDRVRVDYYGAPTPLNQVANLSTPDARTIVVQPFEKRLIGDIERAIFKADLGLSPTNDGNLIRIAIPPLTEERRKEIVKSVKKLAEEARVAIRQERRDANDEIKQLEKAKEISEDDSKRLQGEIQKLTDKYISIIDQKAEAKEKEVLQV